MKKILSLLLAVVMVMGLCAVSAAAEASDVKIGFIFLHDENSTYDANFINAAKEIKKLFNLSDDQVIMKTQVSESNDCYETAKE